MTFVRATLLAAALLDLGFAVLILIPARALTEFLGIPVGSPVMHFRFAGLIYALLPIFYLIGAASPRLAPPIAAGAVLARAGGTIFLTIHLATGQAVIAYWYFCLVEAGFGILHWVALRRGGWTLLSALRDQPPSAGHAATGTTTPAARSSTGVS